MNPYLPKITHLAHHFPQDLWKLQNFWLNRHLNHVEQENWSQNHHHHHHHPLEDKKRIFFLKGKKFSLQECNPKIMNLIFSTATCSQISKLLQPRIKFLGQIFLFKILVMTSLILYDGINNSKTTFRGFGIVSWIASYALIFQHFRSFSSVYFSIGIFQIFSFYKFYWDEDLFMMKIEFSSNFPVKWYLYYTEGRF